MLPRVRVVSALLLSAFAPLLCAQAPTTVAKYQGTVGRQRVTMLLDLNGDSVEGGRYSYDAQKSEIHIVESRIFGTTLVLQDEDGNILHLHFKGTQGAGAPDLRSAVELDGTLNRGELDLPVQLRLDRSR